MDKLINQVLHDRYHIHVQLSCKQGRRTYLAIDSNTDSTVVIKVVLLEPDFIWDDPKLFEREVETLTSLNHKAIPKYLDAFDVETEAFKGFAIVQSYIEAKSLQDWVNSGRSFSEAELKGIATELLDVLNVLHQRQPPVIHRDIKPSNVLLGERSGNSPGSVHLIDFGSVQAAAHEGTITMVGTHDYMPVEQFGGRAVPASDLYSLGRTLIYLSTGKNPVDLSPEDLQIELRKNNTVSPSFSDWICWLTAIDVSHRPSSARAALEQIDQPPTLSLSSSASLSSFHKPASEIQLKKTPTCLELEIPNQQVQIAFEAQYIALGCIGFLFILILIIYSGFFWYILGGFTLFVIIANFIPKVQKVKLTGPYTIRLDLIGDEVKVSAFSLEDISKPLLGEKKLKTLSAGPKMPNYHLNIICTYVVCVTGNREEIQWLCDELSTWSKLDIQYKESFVAEKSLNHLAL